jgi:hypothetical protein
VCRTSNAQGSDDDDDDDGTRSRGISFNPETKTIEAQKQERQWRA